MARGRLAGCLIVALTMGVTPLAAARDDSAPLHAEVDRRAASVDAQVVSWRRDIHQHPELGNRETRTAALVADHLRSLGIEVRTGVAKTGVVGVLRGAREGKVVALRADMDALPVTEEVNLPFASKVHTTWGGQEVGVMHACGHDNHVAVLMGVASVLAGMREQLQGTVKFIFQPAEEGLPIGEEGGASLMIQEGVLENPKPDAIFALHVFPGAVGTLGWRSGSVLASSDTFRIIVRGRQTHGALPWLGVDPIVVASQIVLGLQTIVSRRTDLTVTPAVVTVGIFHGGVRMNVVPDDVRLEGTIRAFDEGVQGDIHRNVEQVATSIAQASGATAEVAIKRGNPVTYNDPDLMRRMVPTLARVAGQENVREVPVKTVSEDFSLYQKVVPGLLLELGATPKGRDPASEAVNHSPRFFVDEAVLPLGVRLMSNLAVDFLSME
jgi:amidohydrolase